MRSLELVGVFVALAVSGPSFAASDAKPGCRQETPETFVIHGSIDAAMANCVRERFQLTTRELVLRSPGGDVSSALEIAERFEGRRLTMRVRRQCSSSCANYFLPLAGRIVIEPGGTIVIHGSIDPWTIARMAGRREEFVAEQMRGGAKAEDAHARYDQRVASGQALVERQATFAARNRILPGWLLYREAGADGGQVTGLSAAPRDGRYILVEESMLRSCLPEVEVETFQADLRRHWLRSFRRLGLMWTQTRPSGAAVCRAPEPS